MIDNHFVMVDLKGLMDLEKNKLSVYANFLKKRCIHNGDIVKEYTLFKKGIDG